MKKNFDSHDLMDVFDIYDFTIEDKITYSEEKL